MDLGGIIIGLFTALVVKVAVMILGARLVLKLYRARHQQPPRRLWLLLPKKYTSEVRVLWWSLLLFVIAELTCGIEIYILSQSNPVLTGTHSVVSGFGTGLFALGIFLLLDKKVLLFGQRGCLGNRFCEGCTIDQPERCKFELILLLMGTFVVLAAIPPFFAVIARMDADMRRLILPFASLNAWFTNTAEPWLMTRFWNYQPSGAAFQIPSSMFVIEFRVLPVIALLLAVVGIGLMRANRLHLGSQLAVFSFGILAFVYLEIILLPVLGDAILGSLGHEVAELWFVVITAEFLRRSFPPGAESL